MPSVDGMEAINLKVAERYVDARRERGEYC